MSGKNAELRGGEYHASLASMPLGSVVYNVELTPGKGGQIARCRWQPMPVACQRRKIRSVLRLPSGEMRRIMSDCKATFGTVGNEDHMQY
jgi:large subunit ribosomal protein L2